MLAARAAIVTAAIRLTDAATTRPFRPNTHRRPSPLPAADVDRDLVSLMLTGYPEPA